MVNTSDLSTIVSLLGGVLVGGGATIIATQLLKSKYIPIGFEKHPQWTAGAVSLIASVVAEWQAGVAASVHNLWSLGAVFVGTLWVAISVYNHLKDNSPSVPSV